MNKNSWLDKRKNIILLVRILLAASFILLCLDFFFERHSYFNWEGLFGFYGFYGFIACVGLVLAAKILRNLIMRPENLYDR